MENMRTVRADWRRLPAGIEKAVTDIGGELHRQVLDEDLFLLALARLRPESPARQVLEAEGVTADVLLADICTGGDDGASAKLGMTYSPASYAMRGRADAFAAALGDGTITPEHVLIALLWDGSSAASQLLWRLGASREAMVEGLRARGVAVPAAPLPPQHEMDIGERVWFDPDPPAVEVRRLDHVQLAMPAGREDDARAFYAGLLGLTEVPKPERLAGRGGCWFERNTARVHLGVDPDFRPARKAHPALVVRGLAALSERLRAAGVPVTEDVDSVYVDDPFGNRMELMEQGDTLLGPP